VFLDARSWRFFTEMGEFTEFFPQRVKKAIARASKRTSITPRAKGKAMQLSKLAPVFLSGLLVLSLQGCKTPESDPVTPPATPASDTTDNHADHDHGDHATADADSPMAKMMPGLKELSPEDYKSAMAQHMCPVSGEMLGTMGAPEKVDVNGKAVWICCDGCKDKLRADPDKYLTKLNK
jgi:Cu(I)/Ag(I) efflux system membrane fusion protein